MNDAQRIPHRDTEGKPPRPIRIVWPSHRSDPGAWVAGRLAASAESSADRD
jgi:hypothetical protein